MFWAFLRHFTDLFLSYLGLLPGIPQNSPSEQNTRWYSTLFYTSIDFTPHSNVNNKHNLRHFTKKLFCLQLQSVNALHVWKRDTYINVSTLITTLSSSRSCVRAALMYSCVSVSFGIKIYCVNNSYRCAAFIRIHLIMSQG